MQIDETVHGCPVGRRCGSPDRQVGDPGSPSQIRTTSGQPPLVAATGRAMADLVQATRTPDEYGPDLKRWIETGASPRASLALDKCGRVHAWLNGRDYVDPEDVRAIAPDVLRHRL